MSKRVYFSDTDIIYETYAPDEYDRTSDYPTYLLKLNARDFGGYFYAALSEIYYELKEYKITEMKIAMDNLEHNKKLIVD